MAKTRKSYTAKEKLDILALMRQSEMSRRKFAATRGLTESTIRTWLQQEPRLRGVPLKEIKKVRYMVKRKAAFEAVDRSVATWVLERNEMGLRVKDRYIRVQALKVKEELLVTMPEGPQKDKLQAFAASSIWCARFKKRNNLRRRRHTTTHKLPYGFRNTAIKFIEHVQQLCNEFQITRERIVNFDQVSRYYENDKNTTIARRGTVEILLRKSSQGHKKFTFTPFITASGKFIMRHSLFSGLQNVPKIDPRTKADVNRTAMWNSKIIKQRIDEAVKTCRGLFSTRSSVLMLLDSYPGHVSFVKEHFEEYKERNIHFAVIPPNMTGILQPLDVALNRSFQQYFNDRSDEYQGMLAKLQHNFQFRHSNLFRFPIYMCS